MSEIGVLHARTATGTYQVDAAALAAHLGVRWPDDTGMKAITGIDETAVTLAVDAGLAVLADAGVTGHDLAAVHLAGPKGEMEDAAWILRVAVERDDLEAHDHDDADAGLTAAVAAAHGATGPVLFVAAQGTTWTTAPAPSAEDVVAARAGAIAVLLGADGPPLDTQGDAGDALDRLGARIPASRWAAPADLAGSMLPVLAPEKAARIARAWADAAGREPRGAYVSLAAFRQQAAARYRLEGQHCTDCDRLVFPPRERCPTCGSAALAPHRFQPHGRVHAVTQISAVGAPSEFAPHAEATAGYHVAVVELEDGPRVAAMLTGTDTETVQIGDTVRLVVRLLYVQEGVARYSFKAQRA